MVKRILSLIVCMVLITMCIPFNVYASTYATINNATVFADITNVQEKWTLGTESLSLQEIKWSDGEVSGTLKIDECNISSSNEDVFKIVDGYNLEAVGIGTATISAVANDGSVTATKAITVIEKEELTKPEIKRVGSQKINIGAGTKTLNIESSAKDATIKWSTSNSKIATVSNNGKVTPKSFGMTTISASIEGGNTVTWKVTVNKLSISLKDNSTKSVLSLVKNIKNYKKGKWVSKTSVVKVDTNNKLHTYNLTGKSKLTKTIKYVADGTTYKLDVEISCRHKYVENTKYINYCKKKSDEHTAAAKKYRRMADRSYGFTRLGYLENALDENKKSIVWSAKPVSKWYKCSKCGTTKAL